MGIKLLDQLIDLGVVKAFQRKQFRRFPENPLAGFNRSGLFQISHIRLNTRSKEEFRIFSNSQGLTPITAKKTQLRGFSFFGQGAATGRRAGVSGGRVAGPRSRRVAGREAGAERPEE